MSLVSFAVISLLFFIELYGYLNVEIVQELFVDSTNPDTRVEIHFDVTFDKLPCSFLSVDIMDISGLNMHDVKDSIYKVRLDEQGNLISGSSPMRQGLNSIPCKVFNLVLNSQKLTRTIPRQKRLCVDPVMGLLLGVVIPVMMSKWHMR